MDRENSFKYRAELPRVVEAVHHRNALAALGASGVVLAQDASWESICKLTASTLGGSEHNHLVNEHGGKVVVDGLLGQSDWRIHYSKPTFQSVIMQKEDGYDALHKHTAIGLHLPHHSERAVVYLITDTPPVAVDEAHYYSVLGREESLNLSYNDARELEAIQKHFGANALHFFDEDIAMSLTNALLNDSSRTLCHPR